MLPPVPPVPPTPALTPWWLPIAGFVVAALAFGVSVATALRTTWWRGTLKMTRPTLIALIDAGEGPKIAVQSFLYGTLPRGVVIQSMHVVLHRGQLRQIFNVWGASDGGPAEFGNGRRVGPEGAALMHHFLLPPDGTTFNFLPGKYRLEVFASVAHKAEDINLFAHDFELSEEHVAALSPGLPGVTFTWGPATKEFAPHVRNVARTASRGRPDDDRRGVSG